MQHTATESLALDISALLAKASAKASNSVNAIRALLYIHDAGNPAISAIAAHVGKSTAALTGMIDALEESGLVRRVRSDADRRSIRVELTFHGREVVRELLDAALP